MVTGHVELTGATDPKELHFKLRLPAQIAIKRVTVNGEPAKLQGENVVIETKGKKEFEVIAETS